MPGLVNPTQTFLPPAPGFPAQLSGPMTWKNKDYAHMPHEYISHLSPSDLEQIASALRHFKGLGIARGFISPLTFPLNKELAGRLRSVSHAVHTGRGFEVLRGLRPELFSEEDLVMVYVGIASYVADKRVGVMTHIHDRTSAGRLPNARIHPHKGADAMSFHTDVNAGDILSILTRSLSAEGGDQHLASSWQVYNKLAQEDPDVLKTLTKDWRWQFPGAESGSHPRIAHRPIFSYVNGKLQIAFAKSFLAHSSFYSRSADAPPLTQDETHALETVLRICRQTSFNLSKAPGDILFVNNLSILHARDAYRDGRQSGAVRHLLNIMLRDTAMAWEQLDDVRTELEQKFDIPPEKQHLTTADEWEEVMQGKVPKSSLAALLLDSAKHD